jgi:PIN domain nuclease of toxin-antitoxin system
MDSVNDLFFSTAAGVALLPILPAHLIELEGLPPINRDPFDRMLVAQAKAEKMPILTCDAEIARYDVAVL